MIKITTRNLTKKEWKKLNNDIISSRIGDIENFILTFVLFALVGLLFFFIPFSFFSIPDNIQGWCALAIIIGAFIFSLKYYSKFKKETRIENQMPLKKVNAEIVNVKTKKAIKRKDPEDFGVAFYIDVKDSNNKSKTLFLWGQYLDFLVYDKKFPNTEFNIIRRSDTKQTMDIEVLGDYFKPEKTLPPFSNEVWASGEIPKDGEILNTSIDEIGF